MSALFAYNLKNYFKFILLAERLFNSRDPRSGLAGGLDKESNVP